MTTHNAATAGDRWDAIVIGSGMGGLTAAAYLAAADKRTLVLEAGDVLGGCTHVFRRNGFEFEVGVHYLGDCGPDGAIPAMLRGVGIDGRIDFLPMDRDGFDTIVYPDVTVKVPQGWDNYLANLIAAFPGDEVGLRKFVGVMRALGEATDRLVTPSSNWNMPGLALRAGTATVWAMQPLGRLLDACQLSIAARAVLSTQASYLSPPHRAATMVHAVFLHNYIRDGAYFPAGGGQVFAAHLASVVTAHGGRVRTNARVGRIVVESGRVTGVELTTGERIAADVVISNADIKHTLLDLVGPDHLPSRLVRRTDGYRMSVPLVNLYVALDIDLRDAIPNTNYFSCPVTEPSDAVFGMGERAGDLTEPEIEDYLHRLPAFVTFQSVKDPDNDVIAPKGYTNLEIMSGAPSDYRFWGVETGPYDGGRYRRRADYLHRKEQYTEALLDRGAAVVPGLRDHIVHVETGTPITQERYTLSTGGVAYGIDLSWNQFGPLRPGARTPVKGLFLAGASLSWGPGVEGAMASGVGAASAVLDRNLARELRCGAVLAEPGSLPPVPSDFDALIAAGGPKNQRRRTTAGAAS